MSDKPTPVTKISGTYSIFVTRCSELETRLVDLTKRSAESDLLLGRTRELKAAFQDWPNHPPTQELRDSLYADLLTTQREIDELLGDDD